ncbi:hypothetical protein L7F22_049168 [Adiantum nelumboides]|nr:hypothetical protein [Adiantum nelumboides]
MFAIEALLESIRVPVQDLEELCEQSEDYILVPLDNYISRSTEHFLACKEPDYQQSLFKLISRVFADHNFEDNDIEPAPKLIEAVLQNCKGRVDEWVEPYLKVTVERLRRTQKGYLKDLLIEVVANALYYNPGLSLSILQRMGVTAEVFQTWFNLLQERKKSGQPAHFRREHDKKVCILGLLSLLPLSTELMPQEVQAGIDQIFKAVLQLLMAYKQQLEESAKKQNVAEDDEELESSGSERDNWDNDLEDKDEDNDEADAEKLQKLAAEASAFRRHSEADEDSNDDFTDDEEFQAPIDVVDPFILFADIMQGMSMSDPARFQAYTQLLDPQQQAVANSLALHAEERRKAIQKDSS